jgi:hypothetical protein
MKDLKDIPSSVDRQRPDQLVELQMYWPRVGGS